MSSGHDDYAVEPIRGLPEALPQGETILWQGAPDAWEIAKHVFHIRLAALYLFALAAWRFQVHLPAEGLKRAVIAGLSVGTIALPALGLLALLAWLCSRTSVYTITSRRIVMRIGIALPTAINIPFATILAASQRVRLNGSGDISLLLGGDERVAWSNFWPHVRPWKLAHPQPTLRGIPHVHGVAALLADAMMKALPAGQRVSAPSRATANRPERSAAAVLGGQTA